MNKIYLAIVAIVVTSVGIIIVLEIMRWIPDWQQRSQFGDMFGVVDAFFSGLAFIGLIYTIFLQREEMKKQMEAVEKSNQLSSLATLVAIYSADEEKYKQIDNQKSIHAKQKKEEILGIIEREYSTNLNTRI